MSHFDYKEEEAHRVTNRAKRLAEYLASIIERSADRLNQLDEEKNELDRSASKIVTTNRDYTWEELGEKLLEYEGWRIKIEVF